MEPQVVDVMSNEYEVTVDTDSRNELSLNTAFLDAVTSGNQTTS